MPREGHKFSSWSIRSLSTHFNPHTPRGARQRDVDFGVIPKTFQSTCPARGTTKKAGAVELGRIEFQSTCPARGTTHANKYYAGIILFQSTCPARGTTRIPNSLAACILISIHVPREGHDSTPLNAVSSWSRFQSTCPARGTTSPANWYDTRFIYFNPRAPRGARLSLQKF